MACEKSMTLEDFFTLAENKDGLTALARVEELVSVMKKGKNSVSKHVTEAARQWSTVASTLSATENKDCLNLFIRLDGLQFLNQWLQEAQKVSNDISDNFVEESIAALLGALEKLPIDNEISNSSGIRETLEGLFGQKSLSVRDRARALSDSWSQGKDKDKNHQDVEKSETSCDAENGSSDLKIPISNNQDTTCTTLSQAEENGFIDGQGSSIKSDPCQKSPIVGSSTPPSEGITSTQMHSPEETVLLKVRAENLGKHEIYSICNSVGPKCTSSTFNPDAQQSVMEPAVRRESDAKENELSSKKNSPLGLDTDMGTLPSEPKIGSNILSDISSSESVLRNPKDPEFPSSNGEDTGLLNNAEQVTGESISRNLDKVSGHSKDSKDSGNIDKKYETESKYGVDDALEVTRQATEELDREVEGYKKPFCGTSFGKSSECGMKPDSPKSINGEQEQTMMGPQNEVPTGQNLLGLRSSDTIPNDCLQDPESSQVTEGDEEPDSNTGNKGVFDLNQEILWEEMEHSPMPVSIPVLVVAASKVASAPGLPVAPLQFEGASGWKGSAATSAFRPASPRRTPDYEKTFSIGESSYSSKRRQDFLDFDLNVARDEDGLIDPVLPTLVPVSSGLLSGDSSIEVSSKRAKLLKLDLNLIGDNDDAQSSDWRMDGVSFFNHRNGHGHGHSSSSPASSSSSRQPSLMNIDLNDNPSFIGDSNSSKSSSREMNSYVGLKLHEPVISIMGAKVEVKRKEIVPQNQSFLPNGLMCESMMGVSLTRSWGSAEAHPPPVFSYPHYHPFGFNAIGMGPTMSLSPVMYGPGSLPMVPPIMSSAEAVPPSYEQSPPLVMNMMGPSTIRPSLDLNSGLMMADSESRESAGLRQFLIPGQSGVREEQMRSMTLSLNSGIGAKRKEPDSGWDPYSIGYEQQQPWL